MLFRRPFVSNGGIRTRLDGDGVDPLPWTGRPDQQRITDACAVFRTEKADQGLASTWGRVRQAFDNVDALQRASSWRLQAIGLKALVLAHQCEVLQIRYTVSEARGIRGLVCRQGYRVVPVLSRET